MTRAQQMAAERIDEAIEAREWLGSMRRELINTLHEVPFDVARYKQAAAELAKCGGRVRGSETLIEALEDAEREIRNLREQIGEWTS